MAIMQVRFSSFPVALISMAASWWGVDVPTCARAGVCGCQNHMDTDICMFLPVCVCAYLELRKSGQESF